MKDKIQLLGRLGQSLSLPEMPDIGRSVDLPVYLIHNSNDAEDYYFVFDFEQFVERSRDGLFVRPRLNVWAGRDDFNRDRFAQQFRESFSREFDLARAALTNSNENAGWFSWSGFKDVVASGGASFVANVVLLIGLSAGKMIWDSLPLPRVFSGRSNEAKLEESIAKTQSKVDIALSKMEVKLHKQLFDHSWELGADISLNEVDFDAWPLPEKIASLL